MARSVRGLRKVEEIKEIWDSLTYDQRLAATAFIFQQLCEHARTSGTYRKLIYDRLGFGQDAYLVLLPEGKLISNEFSLKARNNMQSEEKD